MIPSLRTVAAAAAACVFAVPASAEALIGLTTTNALVRFDSTMPGNASALAPITGLSGADGLPS